MKHTAVKIGHLDLDLVRWFFATGVVMPVYLPLGVFVYSRLNIEQFGEVAVVVLIAATACFWYIPTYLCSRFLSGRWLKLLGVIGYVCTYPILQVAIVMALKE